MTSTRPLRWGILGAGRIAATVGADMVASAGSEVVAVGARDADRAEVFAKGLGIGRAHGSYADLLADDDVDVVYIATTHAQHHEQALLALDAGKPILVEKAFTLTAGQAADVVESARDKGLFCMEAMWMRTDPLVRRALDLVAEGRIGQPLSVTADHGQYFPFDPTSRLFDLAVGGGALLDLGVYSATFAWIFLGPPARVHTTGALAPTGADQTLAMQWEYDDDRFAQVSCTTQASTPCLGVVVGTEGTMTLGRPFYHPTTLTITDRHGTETITAQPVGNGYRPEIAEVERCLREGRTESPLIPLDDTVAIMGLMDDARAALGVHYDV